MHVAGNGAAQRLKQFGLAARLELRFEEAELRRQWFDNLTAMGESPPQVSPSMVA